MGRIYQREDGGTWYGYWTDPRGRKHRQSLRTRDKVVARDRLRQLELVATDPAAHSRHTLSQAITDLLSVIAVEQADATVGAYAQKARHLVRVLGDIDLSDVTRESVLGYIAARQAEGASNSTVHKELVVLRRALSEAITRKLWSGVVALVVPKVRVTYRPKEVWLDEHQAERFLDKVTPRRHLWVMLAMYGGLSLGEVERLRWEHVNFARRSMRVPGTKRTSRWRVVPIAPRLLAALQAGRPKRPIGPIVTRWRNVRRDLARAAELAKVPTVTPNDLRRTFASWLKNQGTDSAVVARLLGHTSTKMVDLVYGRLSAETLASAVSKLPGCAPGEQDTTGSGETNETQDTDPDVDE